MTIMDMAKAGIAITTVLDQVIASGRPLQVNMAVIGGKFFTIAAGRKGNGVMYVVSTDDGETQETVHCAAEAYEAACRLLIHGDASGFGADYPLAQMAMPKLAALKWIP